MLYCNGTQGGASTDGNLTRSGRETDGCKLRTDE